MHEQGSGSARVSVNMKPIRRRHHPRRSPAPGRFLLAELVLQNDTKTRVPPFATGSTRNKERNVSRT